MSSGSSFLPLFPEDFDNNAMSLQLYKEKMTPNTGKGGFSSLCKKDVLRSS